MMRLINQVIKNKFAWDVILIYLCALNKILKNILQLASQFYIFELNSTQTLENYKSIFIIGYTTYYSITRFMIPSLVFLRFVRKLLLNKRIKFTKFVNVYYLNCKQSKADETRFSLKIR